ncbi:hypothetical protein IGI04_031228 [Brassica rapa subsp. trilocularis]|uniref:Uncharacterized protein n=1 Tax=Brassica rapa subsp. trilocularis TaxID=1813537 RepID=A0ABQ7LSZ5_BRACM|nr:hypothetical protein IGI04_031228 [Brassica rapa subsp. trilocularis]
MIKTVQENFRNHESSHLRTGEVKRRKAYGEDGKEKDVRERQKRGQEKLGWRRRPVQQAYRRSPPTEQRSDVGGARVKRYLGERL